MKKLSFFILISLLTIALQAGPKIHNQKQPLKKDSSKHEKPAGGEQSPPVSTEQKHEDSPPLLPAPSPSTKGSPQLSPRSPETLVPAIACQTTIKVFPQEKSPCRSQSSTDLDEVKPDEIEALEGEARKKQTISDQALEVLQRTGAVIHSFLLTVSQQELPRILQLERELKLTNHLKTFTSEDQKGEWLTRGLIQAIESGSIDATTCMLQVIHRYKLTNYVPAAHQDAAANLLSSHNKEAITLLLPLTQRKAEVGSLSPRSQSIEQQLKAARTAYGHNPEEEAEKLLIAQILQQLKTFKVTRPSHPGQAAIPDKK